MPVICEPLCLGSGYSVCLSIVIKKNSVRARIRLTKVWDPCQVFLGSETTTSTDF